MNSVALAHLRQRHIDDSVPGTRMYCTSDAEIPHVSAEELPPLERDAHTNGWLTDHPRPALGERISRAIGDTLMQYVPRPEVPCFDESCFVALADSSTIKAAELRPGMLVETLRGARRVHAVVRTSVLTGEIEMCDIGGLRITPWHPVRSRSRWTFPARLTMARKVACKAVISVLLAHGPGDVDAHSVLVGGMWCIALGHGTLDDRVLTHPFLGDWERVARNIAALPEIDRVRCAKGVVRVARGMVSVFV